MEKISINTSESYILVGLYPSASIDFLLDIDEGEILKVNLLEVIENSAKCQFSAYLEDFKKICSECNIKAVIYPNGSISYSKLDSSNDELTTCYLSEVISGGTRYVICLAFDETQPLLYKAKLIGVFKL